MPFSSGVFSRLYNWVNEQLSSPIEISKLDAQEEDFATALSNCLLRDGTGLPTAAQDWNGQNLTNVAALTATGIVTGGRFVPTSSSAPTNGMYLSAANTLAFASNSTLRWSVNSTGNHTIAAPSSGTALTLNVVASTVGMSVTDSTVTGVLGTISATSVFFGASSNHALVLRTNNSDRVNVAAAGNITINAPSSGTALTVTGVSAGTAASFGDGSRNFNIAFASSRVDIGPTTTDILSLLTGGTRRVEVGNAGNVTINAPSSGNTLTSAGTSGSAAPFVATSTGATGALYQAFNLGHRSNAWNLVASGDDLAIGSAFASGGLYLHSGNAQRVAIASAGNVTINAPSSGVGLTVAGGGASITGGLSVSGGITGSFSGDGSSVTALNATQLTSGTVPDARFPATLPAASGANLTNLPAGNLTGTVASARVSGSYTGITAIGTTCTIDGVTVGFRSIPRSTTTTTAAVGDVGKCIAASAGITIPNATFAAGDALSIYNDSASAITITQGTSLTLRWGGTTSTGNRTLAARGMCTIWFNSSSEAIVTGSGLS